MADILTKLAGNKTIAQLAFKQIKTYIKKENISLIVIYVNDKEEVTGMEYKEPVVVIKQSDYLKLINKNSEPNV